MIIKPTLDKRLKVVQPIPLHVRLFIEPSLRHFSQEEWQTDMIAGMHHYLFPIGEPPAKNIDAMARKVFNRVTILNELPVPETVKKGRVRSHINGAVKDFKAGIDC